MTRARLTQIMNLLNLAPEIQEQLLDLTVPNHAGDVISERQLRPIAAIHAGGRSGKLERKKNRPVTLMAAGRASVHRLSSRCYYTTWTFSAHLPLGPLPSL